MAALASEIVDVAIHRDIAAMSSRLSRLSRSGA
jgi:hypothetical protein